MVHVLAYGALLWPLHSIGCDGIGGRRGRSSNPRGDVEGFVVPAASVFISIYLLIWSIVLQVMVSEIKGFATRRRLVVDRDIVAFLVS